MFKGLEQSNLTKGVFVSQDGGKMFEKSNGLVISGGSFTASGRGPTVRKGKNTAKISLQSMCIIACYFLYRLPHWTNVIFRIWIDTFVWITGYKHCLRIVSEIY